MGQPLRIFATILLTNLLVTTFVQADPQTGTAKYPWEGELTGTNVYVRSGPGTNYYPATKIDAGQHVLVLGEKFGWYEIAPPEGCFSYIDMAMVERTPGDQQGRVKQDKVYVRAGSGIVQAKTSTQVVLNRGDVVKIIGEADGFYKIEPPHGASLYVSNQYVQTAVAQTGLLEQYAAKRSAAPAARPVAPSAGSKDIAAKSSGVAAVTESLQGGTAQPTSPAGAQGSPSAVDDMSQELQDDPAVASDVDPTKTPTQTPDLMSTTPGADPLAAETESATDVKKDVAKDKPAKPVQGGAGRFDALLTTVESDLKAEQNKPREQQDFQPLVKRYEEVAFQEDEKIPAEIAKIRLSQIKDWQRVRSTHKEVHAIAEDIDTYRSKMSAERMKIMRARAESTLIKFDLEGELRKSYVFTEEKNRFRLVDPQRQTTIAYVDIPPELESKTDTLIGRLVGIRTSGQTFSSTARVPIAVAASITDLSDRSGKVTKLMSPKPANSENSVVPDDVLSEDDAAVHANPASRTNVVREPMDEAEAVTGTAAPDSDEADEHH